MSNDLFKNLRYNVILGTVAYRTGSDVIRFDTEHVGKVAWRQNIDPSLPDDGKALALVGTVQTQVQPASTIQVFEHLLDNNYLKRESVIAVAHRGGASTSITAETGKVAKIRDSHGQTQTIIHRIYDYDSFGGTGSKRFGDASFVEICKNGQWGWRKNSEVRIRHTSSIGDRYQRAVQAMRIQIDGFHDEAEKLQRLADTRLSDSGFRAILQEWFPMNEDGERSTRAQNQAELVENLYHTGEGADAGSLWGAWQAHTNFVSHHRGRESTRSEQNLVGAGANSNERVLANLYARAERAASL